MTDSYDHRLLAIVIPVCDEEAFLPATLESLNQNIGMSIGDRTHVVLVFNQPAEDKAALEANLRTIEHLQMGPGSYDFQIHLLDYTSKDLKDGVGEARRLGMDFAVENILSRDNDLLLCLDADTLVARNYLETLDNLPPSSQCFLVEFEHLIKNTPTPEGIILYETYLRYMKECLARAGSPFAFVAMGSRIGLSRQAYLQSGGMTVKNATEDFHFLNKLRKQFVIHEVVQTRVYPSGRRSHRIYLGTGFFQSSFQKSPTQAVASLRIPPRSSFDKLQTFLEDLERFYEDPDALAPWEKRLDPLNFSFPSLLKKVDRLRRNSSSREQFSRRTGQIFDGLQTWRFLRALKDQPPLTSSAAFLADLRTMTGTPKAALSDVLNHLRPKPLPGRYLPAI